MLRHIATEFIEVSHFFSGTVAVLVKKIFEEKADFVFYRVECGIIFVLIAHPLWRQRMNMLYQEDIFQKDQV